MRFVPAYSLGGGSVNGWPAVSGTTSSATGRPINIGGGDPNNRPVMEIFCAGGTATVLIEANGGELDSTSNPPSGDWIDISSGGYAMTAGTNVAKRLPVDLPYVRTRVTALSGATVTSYIPTIFYPEGRWGSPNFPNKSSSGVS